MNNRHSSLPTAPTEKGVAGKSLPRRLLSFVLIGGGNTVISLSANYILLRYFELPLVPVYVSVYLTMLFLSFILNSRLTYGTPISLSNYGSYLLIYLSGMALGVVLLSLLKAAVEMQNWAYPFFVVPGTALWNFTLSHRFLRAC